MRTPRHRKSRRPDETADDELDGGRPVKFEALEALTQSEIIAQVKAGMSRIAPLEDIEDDIQEEAA